MLVSQTPPPNAISSSTRSPSSAADTLPVTSTDVDNAPASTSPTAVVGPALSVEASTGMNEETGEQEHEQSQFSTRDELLAHVQTRSLAQGYVVVIHKSNIPRGQVWLRCDLGRSTGSTISASSSSSSSASSDPGCTTVSAVNEKKRKRKPSTRLQNCPFQLYGRRLPDGTWVLKTQVGEHNHPLKTTPEAMVAHPTARRLTLPQKRLVVELTDAGVRPATIVARMTDRFPGRPIKVQDIYNARNYIRRERLAGRVPFPETQDGEEMTPHEGVNADHMAPTLPTYTDRCLVDDLEMQRIRERVSQALEHSAGWEDTRRRDFLRELGALVDRYEALERPAETHEVPSALEMTMVRSPGPASASLASECAEGDQVAAL